MSGHRSHHRLKVVDGVELFLCVNGRCGKWLTRDSYYPNRAGKIGIMSFCKECSKAKKNAWVAANRDSVNEKSRAYQMKNSRRNSRLEKARDRIYDRHMLGDDGFAVIDNEIVRPVLESLIESCGSQFLAAESSGVQERVIRRIVNGESRTTHLSIADRIFVAAGAMDVAGTEIPVLGKDGWNRSGDRYCRSCGTWWHPHRSRGLCRQCYNLDYAKRNDLYQSMKLPRDQRGWSNHHTCCVDCGKTDSGHRSRGLCARCYFRHRRHGTIEKFPAIAPNKGQYDRGSRAVSSGHADSPSTQEQAPDHIVGRGSNPGGLSRHS